MPEAHLTYFQSLAGTASIDPEKGIIRGASMLTLGEALGHDIEIDHEGLRQALAALNKRGKVRLLDKHDGEFGDIHGYAENFRVVGDQIKGDIQLLANSPKRQAILEIAEKMPTEFGLSIECDNGHVDHPERPKWKLFRTGDVDAVALVPRPAANKRGLFAAVDTPKKSNRSDMDKNKLSKALKKAFTKFEDAKPEDQTPENLADTIADAVSEADKEEKEEMSSRVAKLEEAAAEPSEEEKKKEEEEAETKLSKKVEAFVKTHLQASAPEHITKLSKQIGLVRAPGAGGGYQLEEKNDIEEAIKTQLSAGAKSRGHAIARVAVDKPELYNAAVAAGKI